MASGKKNYFRHSFNAFDDEKIQKAIELLGYQGYAYYFILLEHLAKKCEDEVINPITIHKQSLRILWRKQSKSCNKVLEKLQQSGLFVVTFRESFIEFDMPNLSKYLGRYQNKINPNTRKESKVKERKEKKSKLSSDVREKNFSENTEINFTQTVADWQECFTDTSVNNICNLNQERKFEIKKSMKEFAPMRDFGAWRSYFERIKESDFLMGGGSSGWIVNFDWAIKSQNINKIVEGQYKNNGKLDNLKDLVESNPFL